MGERPSTVPSLLALLALVATLAPFDARADSPPSDPVAAHADGGRLATRFSELTGVAIAPMFGTAALGAWTWYQTPDAERDALPWFDQPYFWAVILGLLVAEWLARRTPGLRTFSKALKVKEDQLGALLGIVLMAHQFAQAAQSTIGTRSIALWSFVEPTAYADAGARGDGGDSSLVYLGAFAIAAILGSVVWVSGHAFHVVSLFVPFQIVELALASFRWLLLGVLTAAEALSPTAGALVSVVFVVVALLRCAWSFRLLVFGSVFTSDVLLLRWSSKMLWPGPLRAFSSDGMKLPIRTYGIVRKAPTGLEFEYRTFPGWQKKRLPIENATAVRRGLLGPTVLGSNALLLRLPPRYRGAVEPVATELGSLPIQADPIVQGWRDAVAWTRQQLGLTARV